MNALSKLNARWAEIRDLMASQEILSWDQETQMPAGGLAGRSQALATLAGLTHERLLNPEFGEALAEIESDAAEGSVEAAQARQARRSLDHAEKVPASLVRELAEARSNGQAAWQEARAKGDFEIFEPQLSRLLELRRREGDALAQDGRPYDALLDQFEPGMTEESLIPLFATLREELSALIRRVRESGNVVDEDKAKGHFPDGAQESFGQWVAQRIGFDFGRGRLDRSTHPFCTGFNPGDVRLTWRSQEDDFRPALFGILHEAGHGLYEQGLPDGLSRQPMGGPISLGVHESQSLLWENHVGRSRGFWQGAYPHFSETFPQANAAAMEELWPTLHTVTPTFIRVEADEVTYNLHIVVRFEIERRLFAGELEVAELPRVWDDLYEELLGIRPDNMADGVLQDIHWSMGAFGYFPTYTLGTLLSAQLYATAEVELGNLEEQFAAGEFEPLLGWLRDKVHSHASRHMPQELVKLATGRALSPNDFLAYVKAKTERVYDLR